MAKRAAIVPRQEFTRAEFGDRRLNARLDQLAAVFEHAPERSLPSATKTEAELEGAYRFFSNRKVTRQRLIAPHIDATVARAATVRLVLVDHDTTELRFGGRVLREGLGDVANQGQGFFGHFALAVSGDGDRQPLGVVGLHTFVRTQRESRLEHIDYAKRRDLPRESSKWETVVRDVQRRMGHLAPVHVMDREADDFNLFAAMVEMQARFVVRLTVQRRRKASAPELGLEVPYLRDLLYAVDGIATREVRLTPRAGKRGGQSERTHPVRDGRLARLRFSAVEVDVAPPRELRDASPLRLGAVLVVELDPPPGEAPVEWMLLTTEPVETVEQVLAVVDIYRARWVIEEYFKALKSGCGIEQRQLESFSALEAMLGFFVPIAARLLALRTMARATPHAPASAVLDDVELRALRTIARKPLPPRPTARDVLLAVAAIGGHLKRNGEPGWLVLARGFEKLQIAAQVVAAVSSGARRM